MELTSLLVGTLLLSSIEALSPPMHREPLLVAQAPTKARQRVVMKTYRNEELGFAIKYPKDWIVEESTSTLSLSGESTAIVFVQAPSRGRRTQYVVANVTIEDLSANPMALEEYTEGMLAQLKVIVPDVRLSNSHETTLAHRPAHAVTFTAGDSQLGPLHAQLVWTIEGDTAYLLTTATYRSDYPRFRAIFQRMLTSFTLLD